MSDRTLILSDVDIALIVRSSDHVQKDKSQFIIQHKHAKRYRNTPKRKSRSNC